VVAVPDSRAPPRVCSDIHVERLLGAKRGENRWVPNLVEMVDGAKPAVLNPEPFSRHDGLCEVGCCHSADPRQWTTNRVRSGVVILQTHASGQQQIA
jgi:hypothetical protein